MTESPKKIAIIRKSKTRPAKKAWTAEKEKRYRELVAAVERHGFIVRREELKRGPCWRVMSGACRSVDRRYVFVDSRLSPDDQIGFLAGKLADVAPERSAA